jgi:drug/metabolite transporter (DMT)-like permease
MRWVPIGLVVVSTVLYQLGQRAIPAGANALVATVAAYVVATAGAVLMMPLLARDVALASSWRGLNYGTVLVGVGALGIEIGFLLAYRAGWAISNVSMVANAMVALALLLIGAIAFREPITAARGAGIVLCLAGLWLVARPAQA